MSNSLKNRKQFRNTMSGKFHTVVSSGLNQLYSAAASYTERPDLDDSSKRKLVAATAASVLGASLDKLNNTNLSDLTTDEEDNDSFWFDDDEDDQMTKQERRQEKKLSKQQNHFIDAFLEKLLIHALPASIPDKSELQDRINDPIRTGTDSLSITLFVSNLRKMTAKLGGLFQVQYFFLRIFHWSNPSLTLTALIIYTIIVLHPNTLFILPLFFLMYGVMVPGYVYRHPIRKLELLDVRERGDSLLDKFTRTDEGKQLEALLEQTDDEFQQRIIEENVPEVNEAPGTTSRLLKKNMEFFINMRDLQNVLTKMIKISEKFETFWYGTAGFKDERVSTSIFFSVFFLSILLVLIGPYIPWRFLLILNGWGLLIAIHPKILPQIKELNTLFQPKKKEIDKIVKESERKDIVIDEPPEIRQVEIFEIWKRSLTSLQWEFYIYSPNIFDSTDYYRKSQKPPPGVVKLEQVSAPRSWRYEDETWNVDYKCEDWFYSRGLTIIDKTSIDSNNEFYVDEEFKRRRLYRNVIRYSKPARKPPHLL